MTAYAIAMIRETHFGPEIREYLQRVDATLAPFQGKYRVHGGGCETMEGSWSGDVVVVEFPSMALAKAWYASPAYAAIRPLRMAHTQGDLLLVQGVAEGHRGEDLLARLGVKGG
ncbi:DUF1330 domain-containing protein [Luteimonas saliphila]|uniref:DUF1330 domain-containing protein n=1 Tax=Luteimonas saliphila TaxID=2804919 RepID=UPI00192D6C72|nr:DUF1330 domain-containing protein [Luteimonas saliphila]